MLCWNLFSEDLVLATFIMQQRNDDPLQGWSHSTTKQSSLTLWWFIHKITWDNFENSKKKNYEEITSHFYSPLLIVNHSYQCMMYILKLYFICTSTCEPLIDTAWYTTKRKRYEGLFVYVAGSEVIIFLSFCHTVPLKECNFTKMRIALNNLSI